MGILDRPHSFFVRHVAAVIAGTAVGLCMPFALMIFMASMDDPSGVTFFVLKLLALALAVILVGILAFLPASYASYRIGETFDLGGTGFSIAGGVASYLATMCVIGFAYWLSTYSNDPANAVLESTRQATGESVSGLFMSLIMIAIAAIPGAVGGMVFYKLGENGYRDR